MNKFKNIENVSSSKVDKRSLEELEALRVEAKKLRERFEKANLGETEEQVEEKRRQMEEEFELLKGPCALTASAPQAHRDFRRTPEGKAGTGGGTSGERGGRATGQGGSPGSGRPRVQDGG